eukprot:CAMPEP_0116969794 /NCGR_PEP_ID=MMETSP0467-20121206/52159_1 /TAXON_ID=283647 /ORGANISM="Mesodinium pulex, Strain SPMC105" /LENGTH=62 /DNA_ID=CAMNT_0004660563 /DNA_START=244 /DNA_END=428 /DNA_ORIENTATION=-
MKRDDFGSEAWDHVDIQSKIDKVLDFIVKLETKHNLNDWSTIKVDKLSLNDISNSVIQELIL